MKKIAIVYWSGTGNTEAMATAVAQGVKESGAEAELFTADLFAAEKMDSYDAIAFGCPSMGSEQLEESEFLPTFEACEGKLSGKRIALFGSYGWGDGEWMRNWEETCIADGAVMACEPVICCEAPDEDAVVACRKMGAKLSE
ncbi:MAG: flavodoxin [Clostridia bacterium]|nr:flavodoxin [Clostridia bacterium]